MKASTKRILSLAAVAAVIVMIIVIVMSVSEKKDMKYSEFQDSVYSNNVKEIYVKNFKCYVLKNPSDIAPTNFMPAGNKYDYIVYVPSKQALTEFMDGYRTYAKDFNAGLDAYKAARSALPEDERADFDSLEENRPYVGAAAKIVTVYSLNDPEAGSIWSMLYPFLLVAGLIVVVVIVFRSLNNGNRQAMNFAKSKARLNQNIKVRFGDVAGADEEKEELQEIVEFLKNPKKFEVVGARIPKGVLLVGSPGTGKTLFAKAVAGEANVPFFSISGSDFVEMFVGVGASRVRDLFEDAKRYMPCIIFIDEIDAVGRQRGTGLGGSHDEREQTLNQLLVQMDGFETNSGIIIMAATNRADILDPALLRPGRFDRQIYVHLPDVRGREEIFKIHARNKPISPDVNFKNLARITSGLSGADIENILNEAAILAARANRTTINTVDINEGINKVQMGPQKKSRVVTEVDKRITAYHEAGHAIMAKSLPYGDPVHEVSIIQRGMAAGYTMMRPEREDDSHVSYNYLTDQIAMTMGGRAAEEIVIQDISTGAMGDIRQAATLARRMVTEWGMSAEIGPIYLGSTTELFLGRDYQSTTMYSEKVAAQIDGEIKKIVEKGHATALSVLKEKRDVMDKMVRLLIEKETIYGEDVDACMEGQPLDEIIAAMERRFENKKKPDSAAPAADGRVEH